MLGGLAEFERELIMARTGEGRERAKARGVKMGRKPKLTPHQRQEALKRLLAGEETTREIGRSYNVNYAPSRRPPPGGSCVTLLPVGNIATGPGAAAAARAG